ncbi:MAG TPA: hypothetical protein ENJ19_04195 [Gammaproteobacteria bacterium]|nr:hypothetical protein [Gammaproteobacteria bacterium]
MPMASSNRTNRALILLALTAIALGLYQWWELYQLRSDHLTPACSLSEQFDCAAVWNSPLASALHRFTGIPFAGWGVAFGVAVLLLGGLLAVEARHSRGDSLRLALRLTTTVGTVICVALFLYSVALERYCLTCALFYVLVIITTVLAYRLPQPAAPPWGRAIAQATGATAVALALVLYPGLRTPHPAPALTPLPALNDREADPVAQYLLSLAPEMRQQISDVRAAYLTAPKIDRPAEPSRLVFGRPEAAVHLIDWVDIRCPHCAHLEQALGEIRRVTPADLWNEESRHFPLDSECNPYVSRSDGRGVACLAAKVLICLAPSPKVNAVRHGLFQQQRRLSTGKIWKIATAGTEERQTLERCTNSSATAAALREDIEYAVQHHIQGTPLVVINGRQALNFPPFILALIIAQGNAQAAGFSVLPPPGPAAP